MSCHSIKEHFAEYNQVLYQIEEINYRLTEIWVRITKFSGISYDKVVGGRIEPRSAALKEQIPYELYEELDTLERMLEELKQKKQALYNKHLKEISLVENETSQRILRSYYLLGMPLKSIADLMSVSDGWIRVAKTEANKRLLAVINSLYKDDA